MLKKLIFVAVFMSLSTYYSAAQPNKVEGGFTSCVCYIYTYKNETIDQSKTYLFASANYDDNGNIVKKVVYGLNGSIITYHYDSWGNLTEKIIDRQSKQNDQSSSELYAGTSDVNKMSVAKELQKRGEIAGNLSYGGRYIDTKTGDETSINPVIASAPAPLPQEQSISEEYNQNPENQTFYRETYKNDNYGNRTEKSGYNKYNKVVQKIAYYYSK